MHTEHKVYQSKRVSDTSANTQPNSIAALLKFPQWFMRGAINRTVCDDASVILVCYLRGGLPLARPSSGSAEVSLETGGMIISHPAKRNQQLRWDRTVRLLKVKFSLPCPTKTIHSMLNNFWVSNANKFLGNKKSEVALDCASLIISSTCDKTMWHVCLCVKTLLLCPTF